MADSNAPRILFVPASGPAGSGEYMRCLMLAGAFARRWEGAQCHFVVNERASYARTVPYPTLLLESSPAHATAAVNRYIESVRPDVVIFDNTGRASQLRAAKKARAACVFISSRPRARRKGLRFSRIRSIDQHWVAQPQWATRLATMWERLKKRLHSRIETLHLDAVFEDSEPVRRARLRDELGLQGRSYLAFCAGGGGNFGRGPRAPDVLLEAAAVVSSRMDCVCVVVLGPNYDVATAKAVDGVVIVGQLDNASLMDLIHDADLLVTSGGDVLMQALVLGKLCVAFPVAGDQPARIARCAERGLVEPVDLASESISRVTLELLGDATRRATMLRNIHELKMCNGLHTAITAVESLLSRHARGQVG